MIALDASAFLAFLFREAGYEGVAAVIETTCLSAVNLSEVIGRFVRDGHDALMILHRLTSTSIKVVSFGAADAGLAASLVPLTRPLGLSLGDGACLALALARKIPAVTADRRWVRLKIGIDIELVR